MREFDLLQAALETVSESKARIVHDHGVSSSIAIAAVIKTHNLSDIKAKPRHPESNGIVDRFNGAARHESDNDYGTNYLEAEALIAKLKLMRHYNDEITCDSRFHDAGDLASWRSGWSSR